MRENDLQEMMAIEEVPHRKKFVEDLCYSVKETAAALKCSERMVQKQIYAGNLGAFKIGRRLLVSHTQIQEFINKNTL